MDEEKRSSVELKPEPKIVTELAQIGEAIKEQQEATSKAKEGLDKEEFILVAGEWVPRRVKPPLYRLFIYGTMKHGFQNHHYIEKSKMIANSASVNDYCLSMDGTLPVMFKHWNCQIWGVVYEATQETVDTMDRMEGVHFNFYHKQEVEVHIGSSLKTIPCIAYIRDPPFTPTYRNVISGSYTGRDSYCSVKPTPDQDGKIRPGAVSDYKTWQEEVDKEYPLTQTMQGAIGHPINCPCQLCKNIRNDKIKAKKPGVQLLDPGIFLWGYPVLDDGTRTTFK